MITISESRIPQKSTTTIQDRWQIIIECDTYHEKEWLNKKISRGCKKVKSSRGAV